MIKGNIANSSYFITKNEEKNIIKFCRYFNKGDKIIDLGAGNKPYKKIFTNKGIKYISIDFEGEHDYLLDLNKDKLPFQDKSIDGICLFQVLEHIFDTKHLLDEINRVLKKGGALFISTPFIFPLHGIPYDFHRYTQYFYERVGEKYNYKILHKSSGIYGIGNIFYVINLFLGYYCFFKLYKIIISPIILIGNLIIYINNYLTKFLPKVLQFPFKNKMVSDYIIVYKKL